MDNQDYKIVSLEEKHLDNLAGLIKMLWDNLSHDEIVQLLKWRYLQHPFQDIPLGVVLLKDNEVLGFRGWFILKLVYQNNVFFTSNLVDEIVHPSERRKGWIKKLTEFSLKTIHTKLNIPFTTASTTNLPSTKGHLKNGYQIIFDLQEVYKLNINAFLTKQTNSYNTQNGNSFTKKLERITITNTPKMNAMERLFDKRNAEHKELLNVKWESAYLEWRFKRPDCKYVFTYLEKNSIITGFLVFKYWGNGRYSLVEFIADSNAAFKQMLKAFSKTTNPKIISCWQSVLKSHHLESGFYPVKKWMSLFSNYQAQPFLFKPNPDFKGNAQNVIETDFSNPDLWNIQQLYADDI